MTPIVAPFMSWTLRGIACVAVIAALSGCTIVQGDASTGKISVYTLMTSRKDVTIEHHPDGTAVWKATESAADTSTATTALNLSAALARAAGAPVAP